MVSCNAGSNIGSFSYAGRQENSQSCNSSGTGLGVTDCGKVTSVPVQMIQAEKNRGISKDTATLSNNSLGITRGKDGLLKREKELPLNHGVEGRVFSVLVSPLLK